MSQAPDARVRFSRLGLRLFAAGMLVASVAAVAFVIMQLQKHDTSATPPATQPVTHASPWGATQAGYREVDAPVAKALRGLPVQVRLPASAGKPAGVYRAAKSVRVRYATGSHFGVYLLTVWAPGSGAGPRTIAGLAKACHVCTHNRLIRLASGVSAAVEAGGGRPSIVTWREGGHTFEVRGPAASFSNRVAVAAARAIARANA